MKEVVVITGTSKGIGKAVAERFLSEGYEVHGIDILAEPEFRCKQPSGKYTHHIADVSIYTTLPEIENVSILINNAGQQTPTPSQRRDYCNDIDVNLKGVINCTEKYGLNHNIKSIVNMASVSAHNGAEFPWYVASKGGVLSYTKWTAQQIAKYGATCNSLSFGGVRTSLNDIVMYDKEKWANIMSVTPLKKWATDDECADWTYFASVINKSMTGQDIIIDNGETSWSNFVW